MKVLIIEDNFELADIYRKVLNNSLISSDVALTGEEGIAKLKINEYDIVLLDLKLPDKFGLDMIEYISDETGVIVITAENEEELIVEGLNRGADDYLIKPVNYSELVARINALYRRKTMMKKSHESIENLEVDLSKKLVYIRGKEVDFSAKELMILNLLVREYPGYVTKNEIIKNLYDEYFDENSSVLRVHIYNLKKKLEQEGTFSLKATKNKGYRLCSKV